MPSKFCKCPVFLNSGGKSCLQNFFFYLIHWWVMVIINQPLKVTRKHSTSLHTANQYLHAWSILCMHGLNCKPTIFWVMIMCWIRPTQKTEFLPENNNCYVSSMQPFHRAAAYVVQSGSGWRCAKLKCIFSDILSITKRMLAHNVQHPYTEKQICFPSELIAHLSGSIKTKLVSLIVC